jgi:hypothetical protein
MTTMPNKSPEPTRITLFGWPTSRGLAAVAVPAWLSFFRSAEKGVSRKLHRIALVVTGAASSLVLICFALGEIENEASGRGPEFDCFGLGQQRAKNILYWDRIGLASVGWRSARAMNRAMGEYSGLGNNFARGWVMAVACGFVALSVGASGYYFTLSVGTLIRKPKTNKP